MNDDIFSKPGWKSVSRSMARDSRQTTKYSGENILQLNTHFELVVLLTILFPVFSILNSVRQLFIRELKQRRRRRQRERHKTIGLISKNNSSARGFYVLYISLPSSAKQQREVTKFKVLWRT